MKIIDILEIKKMEWVMQHFPQAKEIASHYYSGQYKDHEHLELPDNKYLRLLPENREIPEGHLPALTGAEAFRLLPAKLDIENTTYWKNLTELETGSLILKYGSDFPPIIDKVGLISIGKDLVEICFDMMTRLVETQIIT